MRVWKIIGIALLLALIAIQFVPYGSGSTNPEVTGTVSWDDPQTAELFIRACADCHSYKTQWPWYSAVAPVSWLIRHDVEEGREHFNISVPKAERGDADEAADELKSGSMPPSIYTALHPEARLTEEETALLFKGLVATFGSR